MSSEGQVVSDFSTVVIRRMVQADAADVLEILKESREAAPWSEESLVESVSSGTAWIAEQNGHLAGFLVVRAAADELEILNMAVARAYRRRGIAGRLVNEALRWSRTAGARRAYLEVRASNKAAISFYLKHGFAKCGCRQQYYQFPVEDAILLALEVEARL